MHPCREIGATACAKNLLPGVGIIPDRFTEGKSNRKCSENVRKVFERIVRGPCLVCRAGVWQIHLYGQPLFR